MNRVKNGVNSKPAKQTNIKMEGIKSSVSAITVELANTELFYWPFKKIHNITIFDFYPYTVSKNHS